MKKLAALLMVLVLMMTIVPSFAATAIGNNSSSRNGNLASVKPFKFEHFQYGIGRGKCPVYSAPYQDAYRCAEGKAAVQTNSFIDVGGFSEQGWLLVRYETNNGGTRTGWIPPKYVKGVKTKMSPHWTYVAQTARDSIYVTDNCLNPYDPSGRFAMLVEGDPFYVVAKYNYYQFDLLYIEFDLDGQPARGFILESDL